MEMEQSEKIDQPEEVAVEDFTIIKDGHEKLVENDTGDEVETISDDKEVEEVQNNEEQKKEVEKYEVDNDDDEEEEEEDDDDDDEEEEEAGEEEDEEAEEDKEMADPNLEWIS